MKTPRFFVVGSRQIGERVLLDGSDAHKIVSVLRMHAEDTVEIVDSAAQVFDATLEIAGHDVRAHLMRVHEGQESQTLRITLAQALPKGSKMDFVVEKLTELGVVEIVPLVSERSIPYESGSHKLERWRRLARTAAQQCGRTDLPVINEPIAFLELVERFSRYDRAIVPWELADVEPLRDSLPDLINGAKNIVVAIGPEGGFSHAEAQAARRSGATLVSLGRRILRTETAGLVAVSVLNYAAGV